MHASRKQLNVSIYSFSHSVVFCHILSTIYSWRIRFFYDYSGLNELQTHTHSSIKELLCILPWLMIWRNDFHQNCNNGFTVGPLSHGAVYLTVCKPCSCHFVPITFLWSITHITNLAPINEIHINSTFSIGVIDCINGSWMNNYVSDKRTDERTDWQTEVIQKRVR